MMNGARMRCTDSTDGLADNPVTHPGELYDPSKVLVATLSFRREGVGSGAGAGAHDEPVGEGLQVTFITAPSDKI